MLRIFFGPGQSARGVIYNRFVAAIILFLLMLVAWPLVLWDRLMGR